MRGDGPAVFERDPDPGGIADDFGGPGRHQKLHLAGVERGLAKHLPKPPILDHDAERIVRIGRVEDDSARLEPLADPDGVDRAAFALQPAGNPDRLQHPPRGAGDGGRPAVEGGGEVFFGVGRVDDDRREAVAVQRDGEGQSDESAAQDDDVRAIHVQPSR